MNELNVALDRLDQHVQSLSAASSAPEAFHVLLQAMPMVAPRAGIYLIRQGSLKGWNCWGYPEDLAARLRTFEANTSPEQMAQWATGDLCVSEPGPNAVPDFGQGSASERAAIALRIQGRPVAWIVAERQADEEPWSPRLLSILQTIAELQLDVALIRKRELARGDDRPMAAAVEPPRPIAAVEAPVLDMAHSPMDPGSAVEEGSPTSASGDEGPQVEAARRFARLVATDIRLYNEDAVLQGRKNRDLRNRLNEHLNRGRETFMQRHGTLGPAGLDILHDAFVQVLAGGDASLLPASALDA